VSAAVALLKYYSAASHSTHSAERKRERGNGVIIAGVLTLSLRQATTGKQRACCSYQNEPRQRQPRHRCWLRGPIEIHSG